MTTKPRTLHEVEQIIQRHRRHVELSPGVGEEVQRYALACFDDVLSDLAALLEAVPQQQEETADSIVMAANAAKGACIDRLRRAIDDTKRLQIMPLNAEECITILEHMEWEAVPHQRRNVFLDAFIACGDIQAPEGYQPPQAEAVPQLDDQEKKEDHGAELAAVGNDTGRSTTEAASSRIPFTDVIQRLKVALSTDSAEGPEALYEWLAERSWNMHLDCSQSVCDLIASIDLAFYEQDIADDRDALRRRLVEILAETLAGNQPATSGIASTAASSAQKSSSHFTPPPPPRDEQAQAPQLHYPFAWHENCRVCAREKAEYPKTGDAR